MTPEEVSRRLANLRGRPPGAAVTAALERIVRTLEAEGPREKLPEAILDTIEAYVFGAPTPQSFVLFSRVLRLFDEHPEYFDPSDFHNLFWEYKWIADDIYRFPNISIDQAMSFYDEMERRFRLAGYSPYSAERARAMFWYMLGELDRAQPHLDAWLSSSVDEMDCGTCRVSFQMNLANEAREFDRALRYPISLEPSCNREPSASLRERAYALFQTGKLSDGTRAVELARARQHWPTYDITTAAYDIELCILSGDMAGAINVLRRWRGKLFDGPAYPGSQLNAYRRLIGALSAVDNGGERYRDIFPDFSLDTPLRLPQGRTLRDLRTWLDTQVEELTEAFDRRAGNTRAAERLHIARSSTMPEYSDEELDAYRSRRLIAGARGATASAGALRAHPGAAGTPGSGAGGAAASFSGGPEGTAVDRTAPSSADDAATAAWSNHEGAEDETVAGFTTPTVPKHPRDLTGMAAEGTLTREIVAEEVRYAEYWWSRNEFVRAGEFYHELRMLAEAAGELGAAVKNTLREAQCHRACGYWQMAQSAIECAWQLASALPGDLATQLAVVTTWGSIAEELGVFDEIEATIPVLDESVSRLLGDTALDDALKPSLRRDEEHTRRALLIARKLELCARIAAARMAVHQDGSGTQIDHEAAMHYATDARNAGTVLRTMGLNPVAAAGAYLLAANLLRLAGETHTALRGYIVAMQVATDRHDIYGEAADAAVDMLTQAGMTDELEDFLDEWM